MPNWCENNLSIYGKKEDMEKIMKVITSTEQEYSLLESLYPTPEALNIGDASFAKDSPEQIANKEKYGYADWYDWRIDKWGCKWPESSLEIGQEYTEYGDYAVIAFNFETPWSPPIEAFSKISQDYPNLLFCLYYEEPGMGFCGRNVWANGETKEEDSSELISRWFDEDYLYTEYVVDNSTEK